jgi:hypothetical protein
MKILIPTKILTVLFITFATSIFSQKDKWDSIYNNTPVVSNFQHFTQNGATVFNNKVIIWGDSVDTMYPMSGIKTFDPVTNSMVGLTYTKTTNDGGLSSAVPFGNTDVYFGMKNNTQMIDNPNVYHYNTTTGSVSSLTLNVVTQNEYSGISNLVMYSANSTIHDSLIAFAYNATNSYVEIFKHKVGDPNFTATSHTIALSGVDKAIVYRDTLFVAYYDGTSENLLYSIDGLNFTSVVFQSTSLTGQNTKIMDMDTINGKLYFSIHQENSNYYNIEYANNTTELVLSGSLTSILFQQTGTAIGFEKHKNELWFNVALGMLGRSASGGSGGNGTTSYMTSSPLVYKITSSNNVILSQDSIGLMKTDVPQSYRLASVNNELIMAGDYSTNVSSLYYGSKFYKLVSPVAGFTNTLTNVCLNTPLTFTSTCLNTDSIRWVFDGNTNYSASASSTSTLNLSFSTVGTHTVGIIAIGGTQTDTFKINILVNPIPTVSISSSSYTLCAGTSVTLTASGAATYSWSNGSSTSIIVDSPLTNTAYSVIGTSTAGCTNTGTISIVVNSLKTISGNVTVAGSPVAGYVTLYAYLPTFTKFDSIASINISGTGAYTFTAPIKDGQYIVKATPSANTLQITYCYSDVNWKTASVFTHGCIVPTTTANISVIALTPLASGGLGSLSGHITAGSGYGHRSGIAHPLSTPIKGIIVKGGKNPGGSIIAQTTTDANGTYSLSGLPDDNYYILVDIPGLDTNHTYHKVITLGALNYINLDFTVDSAKINPINLSVGIKDLSFVENNIKVFPNPANSFVNINYTLTQSSNIKIELFDVIGKSVKTIVNSANQPANSYQTTAPLENLTAGVYFIKIRINTLEQVVKLFIAQ